MPEPNSILFLIIFRTYFIFLNTVFRGIQNINEDHHILKTNVLSLETIAREPACGYVAIEYFYHSEVKITAHITMQIHLHASNTFLTLPKKISIPDK